MLNLVSAFLGTSDTVAHLTVVCPALLTTVKDIYIPQMISNLCSFLCSIAAAQDSFALVHVFQFIESHNGSASNGGLVKGNSTSAGMKGKDIFMFVFFQISFS